MNLFTKLSAVFPAPGKHVRQRCLGRGEGASTCPLLVVSAGEFERWAPHSEDTDPGVLWFGLVCCVRPQ